MGTFSATDVVRLVAPQCSYTSTVGVSKARDGNEAYVGACRKDRLPSIPTNVIVFAMLRVSACEGRCPF